MDRPARNLVLVVLFGALLLAWGAGLVWLVGVFSSLGAEWRDWGYALDPRGKPTDWWFWWCIVILPPVAILTGLTLALKGRSWTPLLVIPLAIVSGAVGGVVAYAWDRHII